ncbi:methyltransferase [Bailinhaonella thermotolerans]|uniref:Methyltransferase domain-containing protein n=1 Tax=Bailinhaonella thermotolerans TaxID=1070861 RepID=A0A3A4A381_9ACTN|nr:methyltransferase [Bailinhaonella thermotolerans]RJL21224.1 methyltransferase domain-containing protein [Bailinhaonella thermotolerans]
MTRDNRPVADGVVESESLIARMQAAGASTFRLLGREWELDAGVFSPAYTYATAFYSRSIRYPIGGRFLEIGCGAGVTAVEAALAGCRAVHAVDICPRAVANTLRNAARHDAQGVTAAVSDVFGAIDDDARYDAIFWNIPYVAVPSSHSLASALSRSVFDVEHRSCHAYLSGLRDHLAPGGTAYLGFGDIGDLGALESIAAEHGWEVHLIAAGAGEPDPQVEHRLYELLDSGRKRAR